MKKDTIPVCREGVPFIGTLVFWALLTAILGMKWWAVGFGLLASFTLYFFRDPERVTPVEDDLVCAPADGRVIRVEEVKEGPFCQGSRVRLSIFMTIFNCHVNRSPVSGTVEGVRYQKGQFWPADHRKSFGQNEQNGVVIHTECGKIVEVVQVAGLIARRIVCWVEKGDELTKGQRIGLIRFGSRVDVYLPPDSHIYVKIGDRVRAGETIIARL